MGQHGSIQLSYFRQFAQSRMNPVLDSYLGETVTIKPMIARPNYSPVRDPARPMLEATAIFEWRSTMTGRPTPDDRDTQSFHSRKAGPIDVASRIPQFSFSTPAPTLRRGDQIMRDDGELFEVTSATPDGVARVLVPCVQLGVPNGNNQ